MTVTDRVRSLLDDGDELLSVVVAGKTDATTYALAIVDRPHPDEPSKRILMERYVSLPADWSDRDDTMMSNGINRRVDDAEDAARGLAQAYAAAAARAGNDGDTDAYEGNLR
jgi:hypothetical protein